MQTLPVSARTVLRAKLMPHLILNLPLSFLAGIAIWVVFQPTSPILLLCCLLLPVVFTLFCAICGLALNLRFVNLSWVSEAPVVKNSASVLLALLVTALAVILPGIGLVIVGSSLPFIDLLLLAYTLILAIITALLYHHLMTRGAARFATLS